MGNYLVTIARQYGSGGREVGRQLAALTGYPFYDNEMITIAAEKSGLSSDVLADADEKAASSLLYTLAVGSSPFSRNMGHLNVPLNDRLFLLQSEIIRELAADGKGAVIVGRCADYVLSGKPNLVRVYITAPFDCRVRTVMDRHDLTEAKAKDLIIRTDKRRANYYSYYTGEKWGKADKYDLVVSTDRLGLDASARLIRDYLEILDRR